MIVIAWCLSSCPSIRQHLPSNNFSSETSRPLLKKLHRNDPWEHCGAVVKHRTLIERSWVRSPQAACVVPWADTLSTLLSTGFYLGREGHMKISICLLNVLPSINKVNYYYHYYYYWAVLYQSCSNDVLASRTLVALANERKSFKNLLHWNSNARASIFNI